MQNLLIGLGVLILFAIVFAMAFNPGRTRPTHFVDSDSDGEPDESSEEKRRAIED